VKYISFFINHGGYIGILLLILGFFLMPFLIGFPIFIFGALLIVFNFHKKLVDILIPKNTQAKIGKEIKKSYEPYQPAIKSMKSVGKDILKTSIIIFVVTIIIVVVILVLRFGFGGPEDSWICGEKGNWIKHGNPSYPSPAVPCPFSE
jgi:hypothetical protein